MSSHHPSSRLIRRLILSFQDLFRVLSKPLKKGRFFFLNFLRQNFNSNQSQRQRSSRQRKKPLLTPAGFVLPTTILVLLVVGLFAGALISRTGDRAEDVIRARESQRIESIAAPAVERAKAKLEYIFNRDPRFPTGVPSEIVLRDLMLYQDTVNVELIPDGSGGTKPDPYTLPAEQRIDLDGDGNNDNAWKYQTDLDGDGTEETVAYSILMLNGIDRDGDGKIQRLDPDSSDDTDSAAGEDYGLWSSEQIKADNLITRTGPLSIKASEGISSDCKIPSLEAEEGWFAANATSVRKNFQVNVFVENTNDVNKAVTALEFQQDRQLDKGNKFGVWFRYDLLIHPGPQFNLNGAVHTDGNLITWNNSLRFYLVSDSDSCIYSEDASIIEVTEIRDPATGDLQYQGQAISTNGQTEEIDLFDPNGSPTTKGFKPSNDSVKGTPDEQSGIYKYSLDPLILYTEDELVSRNSQLSNGLYDTSVRDSDWNGSDLADRVRNDTQQKPYVDDLYRADDRWGPKPRYGKEAEVTIASLTNGLEKNGKLIKDTAPAGLSNIDGLIGLDPPEDFPQEVGLDGYWERRAYTQGLRIIVGQRLELGNPFGWQDGGNDPLNPAIPTSGTGRANEQLQLKSLRDNLAAVQATAVYHYNDDDDEGVGDFPVAILATAAHPGTAQTVTDSTTFDLENIGGTDYRITNFFEGKGTNGWEFELPAGTASAFETAIDSTTSSLRLALTNLAYFAGDPDGAFPPKQDDNTSGSSGVTHPYPQLTMWGDYSNLRRVIDQLDGGTSYSDLSLADKTTLQTAASTLGMLAQSIEVEEAVYNEELANLTSAVSNSEVNFGEAITKTVSGPKEIYNYITNDDILNDDQTDNDVLVSSGNGGDLVQTPAAYVGGTPTEEQLTEYFSLFTPEQYIKAFNLAPGGGTVNLTVLEDFADAATGQSQLYPQIERDREFGFKPGLPSAGGNSLWNPVTGISENPAYYLTESSTGLDIPIVTGCDPDIFDPVVVGSGSGLIEKKVGLALAACDESLRDTASPRYPSLYYLFPVADHVHDGGPNARQPNEDYNNNGSLDTSINEIDIDGDGFGGIDDLNGNGVQDTGISEDVNGNGVLDAEPYIADSYIFDRSSAGGVNWGFTYQVIDDANSNGEEDGTEDSIGAIALKPRPRSDWTLPNTETKPATTAITSGISGLLDPAALTDAAINEIDDDGTDVYISFLDKGMYNGRQQMSVRVLNIDLGLLKDNKISFGGTSDIENWLPNSGLVYAFREDAIREDGIARPNAETWSNCDTESDLTSTGGDCYMDPSIPRDPPKQANNGVSPKPVDYIADPDRRPHGFRLSNGSKLGRVDTTRGLSFITDNPVYILGDFNLHSREEFQELLKDNYSNFYSRSTLDGGFAKGSASDPSNSDNDDWRPSEILADAITFLSNAYCDGVIENAIEGNNDGCGGRPSYRNTKLNDSGGGNNSGSDWDREDPGNTDSPIAVNRNGQLLYDDGNPYNALLGTNNVQGLNNSDETTVNSVIVQGLSPTRENETYGGLHNFPRFNENWSGTDLNIRGSFVQLNFSTYDTGNLDQQDTFKPASSAQSGNDFPFYRPPNRKWGYDVALQYNPPGPIVERLLSQSGLRSEIYQEVEVSDPYIQKLCKAATNNSPTCP